HRGVSEETTVDGLDGLGSFWRGQGDIDGRKNSAGDRKQMRGENQLRFGNARMFKNFRSVAVREQVIGAKVLVDFDEVQIATGLSACAACAGFAIADDRFCRREQPR